MELFFEGIAAAWKLVLSGDPAVMSAAARSLFFSVSAVAAACACGLPLGTWLARADFPGRRLVVLLFRVAMALPTVFVGMFCYVLFSRQGPAGSWEFLYAPAGIIFGEWLLATPIIVGITQGAVKSLDPRVGETALTLGAGRLRRLVTYLSEARVGVMLGVLTAFARCVTELGIAMIVGGNIKYHTRTLATATALEISNGQFARGIAMGTLLLVIALLVTCLIGLVSHEEVSP